MKILKRIFPALWIFAVLVLVALLINERVFVTRYTYINEEIPEAFDGYEILMVSDIHEAPFSKQIIDHINNLLPDMVVFVGDMAQLPDGSIYETEKIAKAISDIPMYGVTGNHETQSGSYDEIIAAMWKNNIIPLDDDSVCIEKGEDSILLLGIKDPQSNEVSAEKIEQIREQIESEFPDGPCFSILLSHRADLYPEIKNTSADLILSGHMHGGIMRLPLIGGIIGKGKNKWLPDYEYGFYRDDGGADMIVSGGCDKNSEKKRYFNPPEVVHIILEREDD